MTSPKEPFSVGNSFIHSVDPRFRLATAFLLSIAVALAEQFHVLGLSLAIGAVLVIWARLDPRDVLKRLSTVVGFLLLIWIMLPFTFEGEVLTQLGSVRVYIQGIELSARISLKSCTILLIFISLVATMPVTTLGHTLHYFQLPTRLVFLLLITYRYLFVIGEEYSRLRTAMRIRCFKPGTSIHSFRSIAYLVGMLFVRASLRAERVNWAMRLRGFSGRFYSLEDFKGYQQSPVFPGAMLILLGLLVYLEWIG